MRRLPPAVVALSPGNLAPGDSAAAASFLVRAQVVLAAGIRGLVLREPLLSDREYLDLARPLGAALRERDAWFCVHDRVHLAAELGAHAVQLGFRSLPPEAARAILPAEFALGLSTHAGDDRAQLAAVDFAVHGPLFDTPSKRGLKAPIGPQGLAREVLACPVPVWAIGGIRPEQLAALLALGARGVVARASLFAEDARGSGELARAWVRAAESALGAEPKNRGELAR